MTRQRQGIWKAASYAVLLLILGYIALLMIYVSGSNRSFSEMESSMEKVIDTTGMKKLDGQMLKRNFGLNSTDYEGVMYYSSESSIDAEEVLMICVKKSSQTEQVTDAVEQRLQERKKDFEGYLPEQEKLLEEAQTSVRGNYIFYVVSSKASEYRAALTRACRRERRMLFSSLTFIFLFLPVVLAVYYLAPLKIRTYCFCWQAVFYAWGEPVYMVLMILSIF